jgi:asparagine synthase (glutamine-hydrolysing)
MCGFCGILKFHDGTCVNPSILDAMSSSMVHRGPDDSGFYVSTRFGLSHRRLRIIAIRLVPCNI